MTQDDDIARTELLLSAVRIARSNDIGDPDRILDAVVHPSLDIAEVHRLFATLIEAVDEVAELPAAERAQEPPHLAVMRACIVAAVLIFGEPEVETVVAA